MGSTRGGVKASAQRAHARWQQNEGFNNHIDLLPPWLAWCTPAQACALAKISTHYCLSNTHVCMTTSAAAAAAMATWSLPSPHQTFFSNSNFCLRKKNYAPPNTHYHLCKKKNPHRFFQQHTRHTSRLCPAAEMVLRSTMQYILYKTDFYIILSSTCTVSVMGTRPREDRCVVCWETKSIYHVCDFEISDPTTKSPGLDTTVLWPNETPTTSQGALCFVWFALKLWCQLLARTLKKTLRPKKKNKVWPFKKKLKTDSRGHT